MFEKSKDIISGITLILIGAIMFVSTFSIKVISGMSVGITSDFVPKIATIAMVIFGAFILVDGLKKYKEYTDERVNKSSVNRNVIATLIIIGTYIFLINLLGFIVSTTLYLFIQCNILAPKEKRNKALFLIISVVTAIIVYYLFSRVFLLMLPLGIFG